MTDLEKVEKLREKADVSYEGAKEALDNADGNLLEALIYLERQGKASVPPGGGFFSGSDKADANQQYYTGGAQTTDGARAGGSGGSGGRSNTKSTGEGFVEAMKKIGRFCLDLLYKSANNFLEATKDGKHIFSCPIIALVMLLIFFFWITVPLFIITLFFGVRYRFSGPDLDRESVNKVMNGATTIIEDIKNTFTESANNKKR